MSFKFTVEKPSDLKAAFAKLKKMIEKENGSLSGDETQGSIISLDGVEGVYVVGAESIEITIHKNPYPMNLLVKSYIRGIFKEISK